MKTIVDSIMTIIFASGLFLGGGYSIRKVHDYFKTEALRNIKKGLSSSEKMANALTGEKLDF
ncbi:MAG: hypothetical protein KDD33_09560 [Bdellovibrionales bacterium]|nr:hypothetical protein [Bdellovibrionales bacterium]